jgi:hypothetical protein
MKEFPARIGWDNWGSIMCDAELFTPLVSEALAAHGLSQSPIAAGFPGTHAVFRAGSYVVKLYAPLDIPDEYAERRCYRAANGLALIPRPYGEGVLRAGGHEWPYVITQFMPGRAAREIWAEMNARERADAMRALGAWTKAYHALPDPFEASSPLSADGFNRGWRETAARAAEKLGEFGQAALLTLEGLRARERPVLVHADLTEDHLLISEDGYAVIDLADSRMTLEPVEWLCVWFELTRRDPTAFFTFLESSGRNWDVRARKDMMASALLHGFGANILNSWAQRTGLSIENIFPEV